MNFTETYCLSLLVLKTFAIVLLVEDWEHGKLSLVHLTTQNSAYHITSTIYPPFVSSTRLLIFNYCSSKFLCKLKRHDIKWRGHNLLSPLLWTSQKLSVCWHLSAQILLNTPSAVVNRTSARSLWIHEQIFEFRRLLSLKARTDLPVIQHKSSIRRIGLKKPT